MTRIHPPRPRHRLEDLPADFWDMNRLASGRLLDGLLGQNIPFNSRAIDRTEGLGTFISHKSTDLRCKTYKRMSKLRALGRRYVRALADYRGEVRRDHARNVTYYLMSPPFTVPEDEVVRILEWYVPKQGVSDEQRAILDEVARYAVQQRVSLRVIAI